VPSRSLCHLALLFSQRQDASKRCTSLHCSNGAGVEAASFHSIAADLHVAPAAGVVFAGVEEEPAAGLGGAAANLRDFIRQQQGNGGLCEEPNRRREIALETLPAPSEDGAFADQPTMLGGLFDAGIDCVKRVFGDLDAIDQSIRDGGEVLAQGAGLVEYLFAELFSLGNKRIEAAKFAGLCFGEQFGLGEESEEIVVVLEQLFGWRRGGRIIWLVESIVECVDQIESGITVKFEVLAVLSNMLIKLGNFVECSARNRWF
jgi:hypothetical protein